MFLIVSLIVVVVLVATTYLITENKKLMRANNKLTETLAAERGRQRKFVEDLEGIAKAEPLIAINTLREYLKTLK